MVAVLPLLIYPVLGVAVLQFAFGLTDRASVIGIVGAENLPEAPAIAVAAPSFAALGGAMMPGGIAPPLTNAGSCPVFHLTWPLMLMLTRPSRRSLVVYCA